MFGNDVKRFALRTFELNHTHGNDVPAVLEKDIRNLDDSELIDTISAKNGQLDCLIGGPPCQGFSQMRRTEARKGSKLVKFGGYNKLNQDPRNDLVLRFLEVAAAVNPKTVVIENVPQFLSHYHDGKKGGIAQQVEAILEQLGYQVSCGILNAADFGVPQLRQRAVIMASRVGKLRLPMPTHADPDALGWTGRGFRVTVRDAISDLWPDPPHIDDLGGSQTAYMAAANNPFLKLMRTSRHFPFNHIARAYQPNIIEIIRAMKPGETWDEGSLRMRRKYKKLVSESAGPGEGAAGSGSASKQKEEDQPSVP